MTPEDLWTLYDSPNPGGQTRLAGMLGRDATTVRRKLSGRSTITKADEPAIARAIERTDPAWPPIFRAFPDPG